MSEEVKEEFVETVDELEADSHLAEESEEDGYSDEEVDVIADTAIELIGDILKHFDVGIIRLMSMRG